MYSALHTVAPGGELTMAITKTYDDMIPEIIAHGARIAEDLDRIAAQAPGIPCASVEPNYGTEADGLHDTPIGHFWYASQATTDADHLKMRAAAMWLRDEMPAIARSLAGSDGDDDLFEEATPSHVRWVLGMPIVVDGQTTFWTTADQAAADPDVYDGGYGLYKQFTTARVWLYTWRALIERDGLFSAQAEAGMNILRHRPVLSELADAQHAVNLHEQQLARRDKAVRSAVEADVPVIRIADMTGLTRGRIYQIRDGRR